ncbi:ATP-binding protein [Patescibacteria group bacterium]|nr:ATP-binding protein [Patescibacteria group bacterium]MBU1931827.1 ATP-binding protein [Patescibacteria group bacterium]
MKLPFKKSKPATNNQPTAAPPITSSQTALSQGMVSVQDIIAPAALEVDFNHVKIGNTYLRTLFVCGYPRFVNANWLAPLINFDHTLDISIYIYPVAGKGILEDLKRKIGEMEAEIQTDLQRGKIADIQTKVKLEDAKSLQSQLAKGAEKFFQFALYITIPASSIEELNTITHQVQSTLGSLLIITKPASLQMEDGFKTSLPICQDKLLITRNMDTTSLATTFPFTSSELTANEGILYGINEHNNSLIIFDRFTMENANLVVFAKSGGGKSYLIKLEALRALMFGTEILVIDPENEYYSLCQSVGGQYLDFSFDSPTKVNPFDLSQVYDEEENELGLKILSLHSLFKIIMGQLTPNEEAILDRALVLSYKQKGITPEPATQKREPPLLEDLYKVLIGMEEKEASSLASRLEKYVKGSLRGIFDQHSNVDIKNPFTVFSIKNLEDKLRPIAMFMILDFIWTRIKRDLKRRLLIVDEAWYLMRQPDSAAFLYAMAKRARKYYLGLTTITQDVSDFLNSDYGKAIVTNSSIQILMKQSPAAIDQVAQTFYLSQGEKNLLLSSDIGEGLFFAGQNHVAIKVVASPEEHRLITSNPEELLERQKQNPTPALAPA